MKLACGAPRDSASMPMAPVPAKASSTRAPCRIDAPPAPKSPCARMLNTDSRTRSAVGRKDRPGGAARILPRWLPATTRILVLLADPFPFKLRFHHGAQHLGDLAGLKVAELEGPEGDAD